MPTWWRCRRTRRPTWPSLPGLVVLTSLAPDHLDWHGSVEAYYQDKLRLAYAGPPGQLAVNAASEEAVRRTVGHPGRTLFGPEGRVSVDISGVVRWTGCRWWTARTCGSPADTVCGISVGR